MFDTRIVTIHLSDIVFLFASGYLAGFIVKAIYAYDHTLALYLLIPMIIMYLAYIWKFFVTSVKKEDANIDSSEANLKSSFKLKIPVKKFYEA